MKTAGEYICEACKQKSTAAYVPEGWAKVRAAVTGPYGDTGWSFDDTHYCGACWGMMRRAASVKRLIEAAQ